MSDRSRPWARLAAMLMACYATLLGLWAQLDPETILLRAAASAAMVGLVVRMLVMLIPDVRAPR